MNRIPIASIPESLPESLTDLAARSTLYTSSCSPEARVYFLDSDSGFYLKTADKGALARETVMTRYFAEKGFGPQVLFYESGQRDYLLTRRIPGEDCLHRAYLQNPDALCDALGSALRMLHGTPATDCPQDCTEERLRAAAHRFQAGQFDSRLSIPNCRFESPEDAWHVLREFGPLLRSDTLIHGDFCLPNMMLDNWKFSGFIDVGSGGLGDRHMDLFWGIWSLQFNLKTPAYTDRFLDAYGRENYDPDLLRAIAALETFG